MKDLTKQLLFFSIVVGLFLAFIIFILYSLYTIAHISITTKARVISGPVPTIYEAKIPHRLTSYYPGDSTGSGFCTGSGLCTKDFEILEGFYSYRGRIVVATATYECLYSTAGACNRWNTGLKPVTYYRYFDEFDIEIDGTVYPAIVLDSCGACMTLQSSDNGNGRLDVYAADRKIDRGYLGRNPVYLKGGYTYEQRG